MIGDVCRFGLFNDIELVKDRNTLAAAPRETKTIIEEMKRRDILLSIDGPLYNVIKIKPPDGFDRQGCDRFLAALKEVLSELQH